MISLKESIVQIKTNILVVVFFVSTVFFFQPFYMYQINKFEFTLNDLQTIIILLVFVSIISMLISILLVFIRNLWFEKIIVFLFSIAILFWLQGNVVIIKNNFLDGRAIDWGEYRLFAIVEIIIWAVVMITLLWNSSKLMKYLKRASLFLIVLQTIFILVTFFQSPKISYNNEYTYESTNNFKFSSDHNVIFIVLDTFQSDIFQELINEKPEIKNDLDGFTYFRNALGGFPTTYPSIPLMLTGQYYDNSIPYQDYIKESFTSGSVPTILKEEGYEVDLFPISDRIVYTHEDTASNIKKTTNYKLTNLYENAERLLNLTLYRNSPHLIKPIFHSKINFSSNTSQGYRDLLFYEDILNKTTFDSKNKTFKFYHLYGAHLPYQLSSELTLKKLDHTRDGYKEQSLASLKIATELLNKLKQSGVYDDTLIIIVADHGSNSFEVNVPLLDNIETIDVSSMEVNNVVSSGIPLMLVKPIGSNGSLETSDAPVTLSDVPKTIMNELNIDNKLPGRSMYEINEDEDRIRKFFFYTWERDGLIQGYLPLMREYLVNGYSWLEESWQPTANIYEYGNALRDNYRWGTPITFGIKENITPYLTWGWTEPVENYRYTVGNSASMVIPLSESKYAFKLLQLDLLPFNGKQRLDVILNGKFQEELTVDHPGIYSIIFPSEVIKDTKQLSIDFKIPDAISPANIGQSDDARKLGISFKGMKISEYVGYTVGTDITFGNNGNYNEFAISGMSSPENGFNWSAGNELKIKMFLDELPKSDLALNLDIVQIISAKDGRNQTINLSLNGNSVVQDFEVKSTGVNQIIIPQNMFKSNIAEIVIEIPFAVSPHDLGTSEDRRILGIALKELSLVVVD